MSQWLQQRYPRLRRRARKHGVTIFFLDEAGFSSEPNLGRTYGLKDQTLVVDGHPSHRAKVVAACRGELELHLLPPYAPDLNPDEFVWQHAKTNGVAKKPLQRNESLKERVKGDLSAIKANPKLVRSFFGASSVVYAKD